eukprot:TRINITY_DN17180_c0_g1_i2.p1 TRINITY_DN17180_c0_g1~~TRINITY_DN17180_c0_g1_i2.p1  ORF type:complete len:972 (+),score=367.58 TRINITY_DN17180_c0_g1_i2:64-2916(+)
MVIVGDSQKMAGSTLSAGKEDEFTDFIAAYCDEEATTQDERLLMVLGQALDKFAAPDPPPAASPASVQAHSTAGEPVGPLPPLVPQKPGDGRAGTGRLRRAPPPPVPPLAATTPAATRAGRPFNGCSALNGVPQAVQLCLDRTSDQEEESQFLEPLLRLLRKAGEPVSLVDLKDERRRQEAVTAMLDTVASALESPIPDVRYCAAVSLRSMIADMRTRGFDDLNPPPPLAQKRDTRYLCIGTSSVVPALCRAVADPCLLGAESLFCLRALRDACCYRAVAREAWGQGLMQSVCELIDGVVAGEDGICDDRLPVAIELLWNIAELDPSSRDALGTEENLCILRRVLETFMSAGHRLKDKALRNDLLVVLTMAAETPTRSSHPHFLSSGITELAWLIGCGAELSLHELPEFKDRMQPFVLTCSQEDFEMKKLLWNLVYLLCFTEDSLEFLLSHDIIRMFLSYVDASCEIPSVVRWPTLQLIDLQTHCLHLLCQLCVGGVKQFAEAGRECLDLSLRNTCLKVLVHVAATENRAQLAEEGAVGIMLALAEQAPEIEVKRDCLQILADTVNGDPAQQKSFAEASGIAAVVPFLSLPLQSKNHQVEQLVFAAIDCVWNGIVGCASSESQFLKEDGMHALLDILVVAPNWIRIPLLSCIGDLLASNKEAVHELLEWQSQTHGVSAAQLLIRLWVEDDAASGKVDPGGVIPEEGKGPPFFSVFAADMIRQELGGTATPADVQSKLAMSMLRESIAFDRRSSMAATGRPSIDDNDLGAPLQPGEGSVVPTLPTHDVKAKIYCIFNRAGLTADSPHLASLTNKEKQRVEVICEFAALKRDEVWREINAALERAGTKPIGVDRARLEVMQSAASRRWGKIRERQMELQKIHQEGADREARNFYRGIMRDCDHQAGKRVTSARTGLSITEAKIRKAQMLKASFKSAVVTSGPGGDGKPAATV